MNKNIENALIDPKWEWGTIKIDDKTLYFIKLVHPVHNEIISIVPLKVIQELVTGLSGLVGIGRQ